MEKETVINNTNNLLEIKGLKVKSFESNEKNKEVNIIKGINLQINKGFVHAIMGPNGSGKSTLSAVIAGDENYSNTKSSSDHQ